MAKEEKDGEKKENILPPETGSEARIKKPAGTKKSDEVADILKRLEEMEQQRKEDAATITMLKAVADKGQLAKYEAKQDRKIVRVVNLRYYNGELVVSWRSVIDRVWKDNDDNWHEKQIFEITTEKGFKKELDIRAFSSELEKRPAKVIKREQHFAEDRNGVEVLTEKFTLQVEGREEPLEISGQFVN